MTEPMKDRPELVVGLVCPLGARIEALERVIRDELAQFGYVSETIQLSTLLENLVFWKQETDGSEKTRIEHRQKYAFEFRKLGGPESLARAAIAAIRECRMKTSGHPDKPANACAYILRQLKHPREIEALRRVYGPSFIVVAGHAPEETRVATLTDRMAHKANKVSGAEFDQPARQLIAVDDKEDNPEDQERQFGQSTRDAYPLADVFVSLSQGDGDAVRRFIQLLFRHPFHTPTAEEVAMNQANAVALRSSDERRQVGAVIVKCTHRSSGSNIKDATIVATGMNEVPRRGGGQYWHEDSPDGRDQQHRDANQGVDLEERIKTDTLREIAGRLRDGKWLTIEYEQLEEPVLAAKLLQLLKRTQFADISEFMRQVHAEMAAIVDAAMRGVAIRDTEMFVTTFPCHSCAKHIIAAGITKVVYLEPYPKSRATMLHREEIAVDPADPTTAGDKVLFVPFAGVAPRQFAQLFSMASRGRKNGLDLREWRSSRRALTPLSIATDAALAYTRLECAELMKLPNEYKWNSQLLCPSSNQVT